MTEQQPPKIQLIDPTYIILFVVALFVVALAVWVPHFVATTLVDGIIEYFSDLLGFM